MKKTLKVSINIALVIILIYSLFKIALKFIDYKKSDNVYKTIEKIHSNSEDNDKFNKLKELNINYKLWIEIENTNINYPIVQGKNNDEYLKKDFLNNKSNSGTIFLDYRNNFSKDFNTLIYGHNMKNKKLFSNLEKFKDEKFFKENNKIYISDENFQYTYEVFSVYIIDGESDESHHYSINKDIDNLSKSQSKSQYVNDLNEKSLFKTNISIDDNDKLIALVTCSYEKKNTRTIVHGKLVNKIPIEI